MVGGGGQNVFISAPFVGPDLLLLLLLLVVVVVVVVVVVLVFCVGVVLLFGSTFFESCEV